MPKMSKRKKHALIAAKKERTLEYFRTQELAEIREEFYTKMQKRIHFLAYSPVDFGKQGVLKPWYHRQPDSYTQA